MNKNVVIPKKVKDHSSTNFQYPDFDNKNVNLVISGRSRIFSIINLGIWCI